MVAAVIPIAAPGRVLDTEGVREAILGVLGQGRYVDADAAQRFSVMFADYVGANHCVGVGNGTDALEIALRAVGVRPNHRVITVANAGFYASAAILAIGAVPFYVDVTPDSFLMSVESLREGLAHGPSAVVLTHLYGDTAAGPGVAAECRAHGVPLVVDCAHATGRGVAAGATIATFSFYPTKNLACAGDGGAVVCDDPRLAERVRGLARYGWSARFEVSGFGRNSRLDELQAAVLAAGLPDLDARNRRRAMIRREFAAAVSGTRWRIVGGQSGHLAHVAVLTGPDVAGLRESLAARGIQTDVHYPIPDHRQPVMGAAAEPLPVSDALVGSFFSLPCYPELRDDEVERIIEGLREGCGG